MKTVTQPYITFEGNCEEAFNFYKSVFKTEFTYVGRFKDVPPQEGVPTLPEEYNDKIMHIALPIGDGYSLFGSDSYEEWGAELVVGNNISLSLNPDNKEEADHLFNALSEGGKVTMQMDNVFWGAYFGMLTDKFGINWMINVENH